MGTEAPRALGSEDAERLLASSAALRRLALRLAPDAAAAEDLLQDAWLAALSAPSAPHAGWLPWMKGALRLRGRERHRTDARRDRRERAAARAEAVPDATDALARLELQELLLRELRALPDPYRRALIERWLEERPVAEIAERTGAPARTVDTRLARGLALLRARLERVARRHGGFGAVLAFLGSPRTTWTLMAAKTRLALALLLLAVAIAIGWTVRPSPGSAPVAEGPAPEAIEGAAVAAKVETEPPERTDAPRRAAVVEAPAVEPSAGGRARFSGRVVDATGAAVRGARVWVAPARAAEGAVGAAFGGSAAFGAPLVDGVAVAPWDAAWTVETDDQGRFAVADALPSAVDFAVRAAGFAPHDAAFVAVPREGRDIGEVVLRAGVRLAGTVVDARGRGVEGARIALLGPIDGAVRGSPSSLLLPAATSGPGGAFAIVDAPPGPFALLAEPRDLPPAVADGVCTGGRFEGIRLAADEGGTLSGRVVGGGASDLRVVASARGANPRFGVRDWTRTALVDAQGAFRFEGLPHATQWQLELQRARTADEFEHAGASAAAPLGASDVVLTLPPRCALTFRARDEATGDPVSVATVKLSAFDARAPSVRPEPLGGGRHRADVAWPGSAQTMRAALEAPGYDVLSIRLPSGTLPAELDLGDVALRRSAVLDVRVVDATDGAPVAGATVEFRAASATLRGLGYVGTMSDEELVHRGPSTGSATTDDAGMARLVVDGTESLVCSVVAAGRARFERTVEIGTTTLTAALGPTSTLRVRVREGGVPSASRLVRLRRTDGARTTEFAATDDIGVAAFDAVRGAKYRASVPIASAPWAERATTDVVFERDGQEVVLDLAARTSLEGRVWREGGPLAGVVVRGRTLERVPADGGGVAGAATTDDEGRFTLDDLAPGPLDLVVEARDPRLSMDWHVELLPGVNRLDLDVAPAEVLGRLVDDRGEPVAGVRVVLAAPREPTLAFRMTAPRPVAESVTGPDGAFRFTEVPHGTQLAIEVPDHLVDLPPIVLEAGERRELDAITATRAVVMRLSIDESAVDELKMVSVALESERATKRLVLSGTKVAEIRGLPPGRWTLSFLRVTLGAPNELFRTDEVVLEPGAVHEVVLRAP